MRCMLCPRRCGADRAAGELGACRMPDTVYVARAALHFFEEPPISGKNGSGTVFFTGCPLGCVFCQNRTISRRRESVPPPGEPLSVEALAALFLRMQAAGAHNLNLVTPTHYADRIAAALRLAKPELTIPVVYNTGGYELPETLRLLEGLVDIYLPDFKYVSPALSGAYSAAPDYAERARAAIAEMYRQVGRVVLSGGLMKKGLIVRHLVLPGCRADSVAVLRELAELLPVEDFYLSLMRQYTPEFAPPQAPANLHRRLTTFEYDSVARVAEELGFSGFFQERGSANAAFTPDFAAPEGRGIL